MLEKTWAKTKGESGFSRSGSGFLHTDLLSLACDAMMAPESMEGKRKIGTAAEGGKDDRNRLHQLHHPSPNDCHPAINRAAITLPG